MSRIVQQIVAGAVPRPWLCGGLVESHPRSVSGVTRGTRFRGTPSEFPKHHIQILKFSILKPSRNLEKHLEINGPGFIEKHKLQEQHSDFSKCISEYALVTATLQRIPGAQFHHINMSQNSVTVTLPKPTTRSSNSSFFA